MCFVIFMSSCTLLSLLRRKLEVWKHLILFNYERRQPLFQVVANMSVPVCARRGYMEQCRFSYSIVKCSEGPPRAVSKKRKKSNLRVKAESEILLWIIPNIPGFNAFWNRLKCKFYKLLCNFITFIIAVCVCVSSFGLLEFSRS